MVTPDLPGFGDSAEPPATSMDTMAQSVLRAMDRLEIDRAVVGGLSMGGYVTLALYRMAPDRFAGMILADTRATADNDTQKDGRRKMLATVRDKGSAGVADGMLPKLLGPSSRQERPELETHVRAMIERSSSAAIGAAVQALMDRADSTALLPSIAVPALVLCGDEDELTPPADAEALTAGIPGARLVLLPGAGHLSNLEAPEPFSRAVHDFLVTLR